MEFVVFVCSMIVFNVAYKYLYKYVQKDDTTQKGGLSREKFDTTSRMTMSKAEMPLLNYNNDKPF